MELEHLSDGERQHELETILLAIRTRKMDDYSAGVLNARLIVLLHAGPGGKISIKKLVKATGQAPRTFNRRVQVARELAPPEMEDLRIALVAKEISSEAALELSGLRRKGYPALINSLPIIRSMKVRTKMSNEQQDLLRGFCEGVQYAHQALLQEPANSDWVASLAHEWKEGKRA